MEYPYPYPSVAYVFFWGPKYGLPYFALHPEGLQASSPGQNLTREDPDESGNTSLPRGSKVVPFLGFIYRIL